MTESVKPVLRWDAVRQGWRWGGRLHYKLTHCCFCGEKRALRFLSKACDACGDRPDIRAARRKAQLARRAVARAVREGRLPRLDGSVACVDCGGVAQVYEHRNYDKPLEVEPTCQSCNRLRGHATDVAHLWITG